jgi:hypothetical protein
MYSGKQKGKVRSRSQCGLVLGLGALLRSGYCASTSSPVSFFSLSLSELLLHPG